MGARFQRRRASRTQVGKLGAGISDRILRAGVHADLRTRLRPLARGVGAGGGSQDRLFPERAQAYPGPGGNHAGNETGSNRRQLRGRGA